MSNVNSWPEGYRSWTVDEVPIGSVIRPKQGYFKTERCLISCALDREGDRIVNGKLTPTTEVLVGIIDASICPPGLHIMSASFLLSHFVRDNGVDSCGMRLDTAEDKNVRTNGWSGSHKECRRT